MAFAVRWVAEALGADIFLHNLQIEDWGNYDSTAVEVALPENISELSKEEKAKILEKLLAHSYSIIKNAVTKTGEWGDYELCLNAGHHSIHAWISPVGAVAHNIGQLLVASIKGQQHANQGSHAPIISVYCPCTTTKHLINK